MTASPVPPRQRRTAGQSTTFPLIDVLRAFAALSVVVYHVIAHFHWVDFPRSGPLLWFRAGGMGVDLFFVISGFVITLSAFSRLENSPYPTFARSFARARLARIVPLFYLTGLFFLLFIQPQLLFVHGIWWPILTHLVFLHSWFLTHQGLIDGVNWSVSVEMQFYLLMLLIAPWLQRANSLVIAVGAIVLAWTWRAAMFMLVGTKSHWGIFPLFVYTAQLPGMADEFAAGIILAKFLFNQKNQSILSRLAPHSWVVPAAAAAAVTLAMRIYWNNSSYWNEFWMVVAFKSLLALCCVLVVFSACLLQSRAVVRFTLPLRYLGTISYGIYLWHLLVILSLKRVTWLTAPMALPWVLLLTLLLAALSWHLFERPLMRRFHTRVHDTASGVSQTTP